MQDDIMGKESYAQEVLKRMGHPGTKRIVYVTREEISSHNPCK